MTEFSVNVRCGNYKRTLLYAANTFHVPCKGFFVEVFPWTKEVQDIYSKTYVLAVEFRPFETDLSVFVDCDEIPMESPEAVDRFVAEAVKVGWRLEQ